MQNDLKTRGGGVAMRNAFSQRMTLKFMTHCSLFTVLMLGAALVTGPQIAGAQSTPATLPISPYFIDRNNNGVIELTAFGDSITRGIGDVPPNDEGVFDPFQPREEAGYPLRLEERLRVQVTNQGIPGEFLTDEGVDRFIRLMQTNPPDVVFISGGSNDARLGRSSAAYFHAVQKMLNVARLSDVQPILLTPPPECCNHEQFASAVSGYINEMRNLAATNEVPIADVARAFANTCDISECELLNLPEGLHPNSVGYDVVGEVVIAQLFQFDIFTALGQQAYEQAFGLPAGSVITIPDPTPGATAGPVPTNNPSPT